MDALSKHYRNNDLGISLDVHIGTLTPGNLLAGRTILLTGATGGIGLSIAHHCIAQGANVILVGRRDNVLADTVQILGKEHCREISFDIGKISDYDRLFNAAEEPFGPINCLINNAGISLHEGDFMNVTEKSWDEQLLTNLKSPFFLTQAWLRQYRRLGLKWGRIVMMASDTSGMGSSLPYGLSKVGIASLTRGLAKHIVLDGIRVNAIAPGTTKTPMTDDFTRGEVIRATTEGKRVLFPDEIAQTCIFLLSDLSTCISGQVIGCTEANICFDNTAPNLSLEQETNP